MRSLLAASGLLLSLAATSPAAVVITEVMSSSAHPGGTNNADWFELTNSGAAALDITGWSWDDDTATPGSGNFGGITSVGAGQSIVFTGETLGAEASWISDWGLSGVTVVNLGGTIFQNFSSSGDALNIYNASNSLVTSVTLGSATSGFTFQWNTAGDFLGVSAIGQDGAFQAVSNGASGPGVDVGSPGLATVPEPGVVALVALGSIVLLWRRRSRRPVF